MAFDERTQAHSERRSGTIGSREPLQQPTPAPAPESLPLAAPGSRFAFERFLRDPFGKIVLKGLGIALLMLGLASIGALSIAKGAAAKRGVPSTKALPQHTDSPSWIATQSSLSGAVPDDNATAPHAAAPASPPEPRPPSPGLLPDGRVVLNLAAVDELRRLPGVGQKRAEAIVALRQKLGKFRRATELLRIKGIGAKRLKQMMTHFVIDPPPASTPAVPGSSGSPAPTAPPTSAPASATVPKKSSALPPQTPE